MLEAATRQDKANFRRRNLHNGRTNRNTSQTQHGSGPSQRGRYKRARSGVMCGLPFTRFRYAKAGGGGGVLTIGLARSNAFNSRQARKPRVMPYRAKA